MQWLLVDFVAGSLGRYRQAEITWNVTQLQSDARLPDHCTRWRPRYQVLRTMALQAPTEEAVRQTEDDLELAQAAEGRRNPAPKNVLRE